MIVYLRRVATRRHVYLIPFGMMGWVDGASLPTGYVPLNGLPPVVMGISSLRDDWSIVDYRGRGVMAQRLTNYLVGNQFICIFTEVKLEVLLAFGFVIFHC